MVVQTSEVASRGPGAGIAALVAAVALVAPASAPAATECGLKDTKRILRTDRLVVTSIVLEDERPRVRRHYACTPAGSRAYRLDDPSAEFDEYGELWDSAYMFRANRGYLAYARMYGNADGDYIKAEVVVLNIRTGRRRTVSVLDRGEERSTSYNYATDLVVSSRRIAAWIAVEGERGDDARYPWEVERMRDGGRLPLRLDSGRDVGPYSLVLAGGGSRVSWRNGDERRIASIR